VTSVIAIMLAILVLMALMMVIAMMHRWRRERYFQRLDGLRARYGLLIAAVLAGKTRYEHGRDALMEISGTDRARVLEQLLLENKPPPEPSPILRNLCEDLGLVEVWQRQLAGPLLRCPRPCDGSGTGGRHSRSQ